MNKERKARLRRAVSKICSAIDELKEQSDLIQEVIYEEQDASDSTPENFKTTDRWIDAEALLDETYRLKDDVTYCVCLLKKSTDNVENAM